MPRSSHSVMSYFNCKPTGSPHLPQKVETFLLNVPHLWQSTSWPMAYGLVITVAPQFRQVDRKWCNPFRFPHLHSQFPMAKSTNSRDETPWKSWIGKTELNTA